MKPLCHIIVGTMIMLAGLTPSFGNSLLNRKTHSDNRWTYIFFDHIIYDFASRWDHGRVYRLSGYRHLDDRWYYHYGYKLKPDYMHRYYQTYRYVPKADIYGQPNYTPQNDRHRKPIQLRDRIPRNSFRYRSPFPRARIGQ